MRRTCIRTLLVAIATAAMLGGCGGPVATAGQSAVPVSVAPASPPPPSVAPTIDRIVASFIAVTQAPDRSMHMDAEGSVAFAGFEQTLASSHDLDGTDYDGSTTIGSEMLGYWSVLTVFVGGRTFTNTNGMGWMLEKEHSGPKDPFGGLTIEDVVYAGPDPAAAGVHRLRLSDPIGAFARAMGTSSAEMLRDLQVEATEYEVKVDTEGRPLSATFTMAGTSPGAGDISAALRYSFSEWGADFAIVPPIEVGPSPPPGTVLTIYNQTSTPIVVRDVAGNEVAVSACSHAFASTFDASHEFTFLDSEGHALAAFSPSPDQLWVAAYVAFLPTGTMTSPDPLGTLEPCGDRIEP